MNAISHGLVAKAPLVLPGESADEYATFVGDWFESLRPSSIPEATVVAQLADLAWRLERLNRVEHAHNLARLEEELRTTPSAKNAQALKRVATGLDALLTAVENSAAPCTPEQAQPFLAGCSAVLDLLREVDDLPLTLVERLNGAVDAVETAKSAAELAVAFSLVGEIGWETKENLRPHREKAQLALEAQRQTIAGEVLLVKDPDARRFGRYRQMIEVSMSRNFELLKHAQAATAHGAEQPASPELRVHLRVVK